MNISALLYLMKTLTRFQHVLMNSGAPCSDMPNESSLSYNMKLTTVPNFTIKVIAIYFNTESVC